jgi:hypothetical protein
VPHYDALPFLLAYTVIPERFFSLFRKKIRQSESKPETGDQTFPSGKRTVAEADLQRARADLKLLSIERDIVSAALTTIYEAEAKGILTENERNQLLGRYKDDLKTLEQKIAGAQKIIDLYELEKARDDLLKNFSAKISEIDSKINALRPAVGTPPSQAEEQKPEASAPSDTEAAGAPDASGAEAAAKEKTQQKERPKSKAEQRLEEIREEVLRAMERLEQIEAEG